MTADRSPDPDEGPVAYVPESLYTLDPTTALVADLDALPARDPATSTPARLHTTAALWLPIVGALVQLPRLAPPQRAAYLRAASGFWDAAAERWHEPRYARLAHRLARWRLPDPTLPLVRGLLWTLEQLESEGGVRLAYTGLTALATLLPLGSRRVGHVLAQSGRPLRTLGALDAALARYEAGFRLGRTHHDRRLRARGALGVGGVHTFRGNHPAARQAFAYVLRTMPSTSDLARGAHHGLVLCSTAAGDYAGALRHGWASFRTRRADATDRAVALSLLADLCTRIGRHESAIRAAQGALELTNLVRLRISLLRIALRAAHAGGEPALAQRYAAQLTVCIGTGGDLHEDAAGWLALAEVHTAWHDPATAHQCLAAADALATRSGYHELSFRIDEAREALRTRTVGEPRRTWETATLDRRATAVLHALAHLPTSAVELLAL